LECTLDFLQVAHATKIPPAVRDKPVSGAKDPATARSGMPGTGRRKGGSQGSPTSGTAKPSIIQNRFCLLDTEHGC
jgi:hypothetical protein